MEIVQIKKEVYQSIVNHLESVHPLEGCGLLAGIDNLAHVNYPITNRLGSASEFEMDPREQLEAMLDIEKSGWSLLAIYHSHPFGPAEPSSLDVSKAYYPEAFQVIICWNDNHLPIARAYIIDNRVITEISLQVV